MGKRDDGGPAFPITGQMSDNGRSILQESEPGMSLRDYFAAAALSDLANPDVSGEVRTEAGYAYRMADAMLVERKKT